MHRILCMHCSFLCRKARRKLIYYQVEIIYIYCRSPISLSLLLLHFLSLCVHLTDSIWLLRVASKRRLLKIYGKQVAANGNKVFWADAQSLMVLWCCCCCCCRRRCECWCCRCCWGHYCSYRRCRHIKRKLLLLNLKKFSTKIHFSRYCRGRNSPDEGTSGRSIGINPICYLGLWLWPQWKWGNTGLLHTYDNVTRWRHDNVVNVNCILWFAFKLELKLNLPFTYAFCCVFLTMW